MTRRQLKGLLVHAAKTHTSSADKPFESDVVATKTPKKAIGPPSSLPGKRKDSPTAALLPTKKKKKAAFSFLDLGAQKAKASTQARKMARAGLQGAKTKSRLAHTGSQVPLSNVMRLKYTKGFTQAVRVPCRLDDLV